MNFTQKIASGFVGLSLFIMPSARAGVEESHKVLWNTLEEVGVELYLNDPDYCHIDEEVAGLYSPLYNVMVICQDERLPISDREVDWTPNDYDTLRHEAHHVVQDCIAGFDNVHMEVFFNDDDELKKFITKALTEEQAGNIIEAYRGGGATNEVIRHELEAFAVANSVSPEIISNVLLRVCG